LKEEGRIIADQAKPTNRFESRQAGLSAKFQCCTPGDGVGIQGVGCYASDFASTGKS
jgi:hypothetical protein